MTDETSLDDILAPKADEAPVEQKQEVPVEVQAPVAEVAEQAPVTADVQPKPEEPPPGFMPYGAYKDEKTKRQEYEAKARETEAELARMRQYVAAQQAQQSTPPPVDMFGDPDGFNQSLQAQFAGLQQQLAMTQAQNTAFAKHGFGAVQEAEKFVLERVHSDPMLLARVTASPNRWEEAVTILNEHKLREQIGPDPEAYRKKIIEEYEASKANPANPAAAQKPVTPSNFATTRGDAGRGETPFQPTALADIFKR